MLYDDLDFRGCYIQEERRRVERERLTAAAFNAWQVLRAKSDKFPPWRKYIKQLGLSEELPITKEELKREANQAMKNAEKIIAKAKAAGNSGSR